MRRPCRFIILFSGIGILGDFLAGAVSNGRPDFVARELCGVTYGLMNLIMSAQPSRSRRLSPSPPPCQRAQRSIFVPWIAVTSSLSTLDSTYTSCAKLVALELGGWFRLKGDTRKRRGALPAASDSVTTDHILIGRIAIVVLAITGCVYLSTPDTVLRATTVSGTMVMGLGPPIYLMLFWRYNSAPGKNDGFRQSPLAFLLSFLPGFTCGLLYFLQGFKNEDLTPTYPGLKDALYSLSVGDGPYRMFFGLNILGHGVCLVGCLLGFAINQWIWKCAQPFRTPMLSSPCAHVRALSRECCHC